MTTKNNNQCNTAGNEVLRSRLDDLYACIEDALSRLYTDDGYVEMCNALCFEIDHLNELLSQLELLYKDELPLYSEEPKGVVWDDEKDRINEYADRFIKKETESKSKATSVLYNRMMKTCELMESIDNKLFPELSSDKFASYSKREMERFNMYKWNKALRKMRNVMPTSAHKEESIQRILKKQRDKLHSLSEYIISPDNKVIYHEGLGRHLWQQRHTEGENPDIESILLLVRCVEHYSRTLNYEFTYMDSEPISEDEQKIEPNIGNLKMHLGFCRDYFAKGFDETFVEEMLRDLLKRKELYEILCDKLSNRKRQKFIYQLAGLLFRKEVLVNCDYELLAIKIKNDPKDSPYGEKENYQVKPLKQSRKDYMSHMIDDAIALQDAIDEYINAYASRTGAHVVSLYNINN